MDFRAPEQPLTFTTGTTSRCISIVIINDKVVEQRRETMIVRITNSDGRIFVPIGQTDIVTIAIEDDDSMCQYYSQLFNANISASDSVVYTLILQNWGWDSLRVSTLFKKMSDHLNYVRKLKVE